MALGNAGAGVRRRENAWGGDTAGDGRILPARPACNASNDNDGGNVVPRTVVSITAVRLRARFSGAARLGCGGGQRTRDR